MTMLLAPVRRSNLGFIGTKPCRIPVWSLAVVGLMCMCSSAQAQDSPAPESNPDTSVATTQPTPQPHIEFASETGFDFGRILDTEAQTASFVFTNTGDAPLQILSVNSTCGCTEPNIEGVDMPPRKGMPITGAVYQPGEGSTITIKYVPTGKRGDGVQTVTFTTNDPDRPTIEMPVKAFVQPVVSIDPVVVSVGQLERTAEKSWTVNVVGTDVENRPTPFAINRATVTGQRDFVVQLGDRTRIETEFGEAWNCALTLKYIGNGKARHVRGSIVVRTNDASRWLISIPFEGDVMGDLRTSTKAIRLGNQIEFGSDLSKSLTVSHPQGSPFNVVRVLEAKSRGSVPFEAAPAEDGNGVLITVRFPTTRPGPIRGKFLILTDLTDEPPLEVSFFGNVAAPPAKPTTPDEQRPLVPTGPTGPAVPTTPEDK